MSWPLEWFESGLFGPGIRWHSGELGSGMDGIRMGWTLEWLESRLFGPGIGWHPG